MNLNFFKTKEFKIKFAISLCFLVLFIISLFFQKNLEQSLGLIKNLTPNQSSEDVVLNADYKIHYLDVGQGNCTICELPDGKVLLIDGGNEFYGFKISEFLSERNINKIDYLIATHADADHIGGLNYLFDKFEIVNIFRPMQIAGQTITETSSNGSTVSHFEVSEFEDLVEYYRVYGSNCFIETDSSAYCDFIKNIYSETYLDGGEIKKSNVVVFYDGLKISGDGYSLEFFAPLIHEDMIDFSVHSNTGGFMTKIYSKDSSNNSSAIFLLMVKEKKFFFSGDASYSLTEPAKYEESDFILSLENDEITKLSDIDVYLVAHHGSIYSSSGELIDILSPKFAVVSVGVNTFGHPHGEVVFRLKTSTRLADDGILVTKDIGTLTFAESDDNLIYVSENQIQNIQLLIPYYVLVTLFLVLAIVITFSIRVKKIDTE